jgi:hypothetical protein
MPLGTGEPFAYSHLDESFQSKSRALNGRSGPVVGSGVVGAGVVVDDGTGVAVALAVRQRPSLISI